MTGTDEHDDVAIAVLGGFRIEEPERALITLSSGAQRLLAFLALRDQPVTRAETAGTLWPEVTEGHAYASLRSALLRLDPVARRALLVSMTDLCLAEGVAVDLRDAKALAHRLLDPADGLHSSDLGAGSVTSLSKELLPGWYDDWVLVAAEDWRQLRLHALEAMAARLTGEGRFGDAVSSALAAIRAESLRESGHGALIRVHLAEGNQSEALTEYNNYRDMLQRELGPEPSAQLHDLIDKLVYS